MVTEEPSNISGTCLVGNYCDNNDTIKSGDNCEKMLNEHNRNQTKNNSNRIVNQIETVRLTGSKYTKTKWRQLFKYGV